MRLTKLSYLVPDMEADEANVANKYVKLTKTHTCSLQTSPLSHNNSLFLINCINYHNS